VPRIADVVLTSINTPRETGLVCGHVIVELIADAGSAAGGPTDAPPTGLGEMSDLQHLPRFHFDVGDLAATLRALLVGRESLDVTAITAALEQNFPQGDFVYDKSRAIKCGVDIALWDLNARHLGLRVCDLLGGALRPGLSIAFPLFRPRTEADVAANLEVVERRMSQGLTTFRVYVGRRPDLDELFLRRLRERFGTGPVLKSLDFSNLLGWKQACAFVERVADVGFDVVESPAPHHDVDGLTQASRRLGVPISEHVYSTRWAMALAASEIDVFNVSVIAAGGITPARSVFAIAEAAGKQTLIGTTQELSIGTAAAAHVGASFASVTHPSDPVGPLLYTTDVVTEPVRYVDGVLRLPDGPGLGMTLDRERLAAAAGPLSWHGATATAVLDRRGPG
jgi:galactarate dehydratase (D-threo-forming)